MGKGGVGKTTLATEIALKLTKLGAKVHLTTTDPANHLNYNLAVQAGITVSRIDEAEVLEAYKNEVRSKTAETMTAEDMEYIEKICVHRVRKKSQCSGLCRNRRQSGK